MHRNKTVTQPGCKPTSRQFSVPPGAEVEHVGKTAFPKWRSEAPTSAVCPTSRSPSILEGKRNARTKRRYLPVFHFHVHFHYFGDAGTTSAFLMRRRRKVSGALPCATAIFTRGSTSLALVGAPGRAT